MTLVLDATDKSTDARHPLAPLTAAEMAEGCRIVKTSGAVDPAVRIVYCTLAEPPKEAVLGWDGSALDRRVMCAVYDRVRRLTQLVTASLTTGTVVEVVDRPGAQPSIMIEEWLADGDAVRSDPGWQAAMRKRGITEFDNVQIDPWPASHFGLDIDASGRRLARCVAYVRDFVGDNGYAHPVENLVAIVDRNTHEVVELLDGDVVPIPSNHGRYDVESIGTVRELSPLEITQVNGPGFTVNDGLLEWGPWRMRVSMHPIEGMVLHEIGYQDGDRLRPIIYRASLSEMVVPYGTTALNHWWKNAFDAGDAGMGKLVNSLQLGCDCLGEIVYLDAVMADEEGNPMVIPQAMCLHEEDYGVLWKHQDMLAERGEVRRSRRLVVSFISTVGNYEYGFFWYFYLDGSIQTEVKMTGIIQTQAVRPGERDPYANPVTTELAGPHHQHLFNFRLDMCVDGPENSVYEIDAVSVPPGPDNPYGNAFRAQQTLLASEAEAARLAAPEKSRHWRIVNNSSTNAVGEPVAYKLMPMHVGATLLADPSASITARAGFGTKHLWVTAFAPDERRAAGDFPNQHPGGDGLPAWVQADRPLVDADVVLWYNVGSTHFCRPEDWPVMPCDYLGFTLKPFGFFDRNPGIDIAPSANGHCHT